MSLSSVHYPKFAQQAPSLQGKTVVITGTTSGTGKVAARLFAEKGAKVYMLNRPSSRAEAVFTDIKQSVPSADIHSIACDLQSFASVRGAARAIQEACPNGIYALCNNAGIMAMPDQATQDGFDIQMQTNHLSHFLLTKELFPLLALYANAHGDARIVNHSSVARLMAKQLEAPYLEKNGGNLGGNGSSMLFGARWKRYAQTKLANAAFTAALHEKLQKKGSKVQALVAHPGFANTELQKTSSASGGMSGWSTAFGAKFLSQSAEDGALGILSCVFLPDAKSGTFYGPGMGMMAMKGEAKAYPLEKQYTNSHTIELLWNKSCEAIGEDFVV